MHVICYLSKSNGGRARFVLGTVDSLGARDICLLSRMIDFYNRIAQALYTGRMVGERGFPYRFYQRTVGGTSIRGFLCSPDDTLFTDPRCTRTGFCGTFIALVRPLQDELVRQLARVGHVGRGARLRGVEMFVSSTPGRKKPRVYHCVFRFSD